MGGVQFYQVKSCLQGALRCPDERPGNCLYAGKIERNGPRVVVRKTEPAGARYIFPAAFTGVEISLLRGPGAAHTGFTSGVCKLHSGARPLLMKERNDSAQAGDVVILPEAKILRSNTAFGKHGRGLGKDESRSTHCPAA